MRRVGDEKVKKEGCILRNTKGDGEEEEEEIPCISYKSYDSYTVCSVKHEQLGICSSGVTVRDLQM